MLYLKEGGERKLAVTNDCSLLGSHSLPPVGLSGITSGSSKGRAGRGWQPFSGDTKREGKGQSKKVSTGKRKQRRQARSGHLHTDLPGCWSTGGCSSLAKACSLNPWPRQRWL